MSHYPSVDFKKLFLNPTDHSVNPHQELHNIEDEVRAFEIKIADSIFKASKKEF